MVVIKYEAIKFTISLEKNLELNKIEKYTTVLSIMENYLFV